MAAADHPGEVTASRLATLLGISQRNVRDLAARDVIKRGASRGGYLLAASISSYCSHLRNLAQGMGGEAALTEAADGTDGVTRPKPFAHERVPLSQWLEANLTRSAVMRRRL
jgi:phage terminase Nu1 subunit (DNA packaging protein)